MSVLAALLNTYRSAAVSDREKPSRSAGVIYAGGHGEFGRHEDRI